MRLAAIAGVALLGAIAVRAAPDPGITLFSALQPSNGIPRGWREIRLPGERAPEYALVQDEGATVLRVRSEAAAGSLVHPLVAGPRERPTLAWRWKVDRVVEKAALGQRSGDDYAARVYVFFDVPESELPFAERLKIRLARLVYGAQLPTAAVCYVWDNKHPIGTVRQSAYAASVRMFVLESGAARAGQWVAESRDLDADFRAAFDTWKKPVPGITGVAVGNDTDQTQESVTAWFGDLRLEAAP